MYEMETARSKALQTYLNQHPKQVVKDQLMFIAYGGKVHTHKLYRIPIDFLFHNIRNGRFRAELLEREEQLKRKLDSTKDKDAIEIRKLLLNQSDAETEALKKDIIKNGQLEPGIITFDGAVINANRRLAIMHDLYQNTREDKYKYLMVGILPQGVDEVDLWKIEAGLQFGRDFRLQYGGVNELLKLKEGETQGLNDKDISVALLGRFTDKQVREKLDILNLIDSYLSFIGKHDEYHLITEGQILEKFNSLQKNVISSLKKTGKKKKEIAELTAIAFSLINKTNLTHWNIRQLRDISTNVKADTELRIPFAQNIPNNVKEIKVSPEKLREAFVSAQEVIQNTEEGDKPERLLKRAKSALEGIDENSEKLKENEVRTLLTEVKKRVEILIAASKA
jgi:hypothetical protein